MSRSYPQTPHREGVSDSMTSQLKNKPLNEKTYSYAGDHHTGSDFQRYVGLRNQESTCYLNTALQTLFMTESFREAVESLEDPEGISDKLKTLFRKLKNRENACTKKIMKVLDIKAHEQSDASEYLQKILNLVQPQLSKIFKGEKIDYTKCCNKTCKKSIETKTPFFFIPVDLLADPDGVNVKSCFDAHFSVEDMVGENQLYCCNCEMNTDHEVRCELNELPEILVMHLKRFYCDYSIMDYKKDNCTVKFPTRFNEQENMYDLYGIVEHVGSLRSGHYYVNIKSFEDDRWYQFNDSTVYPEPEISSIKPGVERDNEITSKTACLLLYRRCSDTETTDSEETGEENNKKMTRVTKRINNTAPRTSDDPTKKKKPEDKQHRSLTGEKRDAKESQTTHQPGRDSHVGFRENEGGFLTCDKLQEIPSVKSQEADTSEETKSMATANYAVQSEDSYRIVLLGTHGVGKSASGNTIVGKKKFKESSYFTNYYPSSTTRVCQKESTEFRSRRVTVIDTPGLIDKNGPNEETRKEIVKCITMAAPGPHVFLLVLTVGQRFTQEEKEAVKMIQKHFGEESRRYTMVLFTRGDDLRKRSIDDYINDPDRSIQNIIYQCGNRYHVFNNKNTEEETQVTDLLKKIDSMVAVNGGSCYTNEMFQNTEKALQEEQERILKEKKGDIEREKEELRAKHEAEQEKLKKMMEQNLENEKREKEKEFQKREAQIMNETKKERRKEMSKMLKDQQEAFTEEMKKTYKEQLQKDLQYQKEKYKREEEKLMKHAEEKARWQAEEEFCAKQEKKGKRAY